MEPTKSGIKYTGVVLAGGKNSRFNGLVKANIVLEGKPIIQNTLDILEEIFDDILIVTNDSDHFSAFTKYRMVPDIYKDIGPLGGLHAALSATDTDALFLVASDMPRISPELIRKMISFYEKAGCEIVIPRHGGMEEPLHALYSSRILSRLDNFLASTSRYAIREFLKLADVSYMEVGNTEGGQNPFVNINRPEDLERLGETDQEGDD